jgi:hypothetical protein
MTAFGNGSDRAWGVIGLVMFGVGGGAWIVGEWFTPAGGRPRDGLVSLPSRAIVPALILPLRGGKVGASLVSVAAFFVSCVVLAIFTEAFGKPSAIRLFWVACAVLLGLVLGTAFRRRRQRDYLLALTPRGILTRLPTEARFVPWQAVRAAGIVERLGQIHLTLDLEPGAGEEREGGFPGDELGTRLMIGHQWSFPITALPIPPTEALAVVRTYLDDPSRRVQLGSGQAAATMGQGSN